VRLLDFFADGVKNGRKLHQFEKYAIGTYRVPQTLNKLCDGRRNPSIPTFSVVNSLLHAAVLRLPSLNVLEQQLETAEFQQLVGLPAHEGSRAISADTMADVLDSLDIGGLEQGLVDLVKRAERNEDGDIVEEKVTQHYHRFVVAFLIAPTMDMTLAIEPVLAADLRTDLKPKEARHEGELTAALRLLDRLQENYGSFIDAFALDGLYPCGPAMMKLQQYGYGAFIITKNKRHEPYRFAQETWQQQPVPDDTGRDPVTDELVEFWDLKNVDTLSSFKGSVDMLKAVVTRKNGKKNTWAIARVGKAKQTSNRVALRIMRARWHIENTAFHQWVTKWNLDHC